MYFFETKTICFLVILHLENGLYVLYVSSGRMLFSFTYNSPFQCTYYPLLQLFHTPRPLSIPHLSHSPPPPPPTHSSPFYLTRKTPEPVILNVYGAPELIPRNEFRQPM
jgi:hypothetical protein